MDTTVVRKTFSAPFFRIVPQGKIVVEINPQHTQEVTGFNPFNMVFEVNPTLARLVSDQLLETVEEGDSPAVYAFAAHLRTFANKAGVPWGTDQPGS